MGGGGGGLLTTGRLREDLRSHKTHETYGWGEKCILFYLLSDSSLAAEPIDVKALGRGHGGQHSNCAAVFRHRG
jgi:hypothetical protein